MCPFGIYELSTYAHKLQNRRGPIWCIMLREKMFEAILKDGVTKRAKNQTSKPRSTRDLNQAQ